MKVLLTGGAGYIGSHTGVLCLNMGYDVVVVDNLSNSKKEVFKRIEKITGRQVTFYPYDLLDKEKLEEVFNHHQIDFVIHFAGFKAVGESTEMPLHYYHNNITGTLCLLEKMEKHGIYDLVFSSSSTVYGSPKTVPILENSPLRATNPYGRTKLMIEEILRDVYAANRNWGIVSLRYFNPIGAHASGLIGEYSNDIPNNLLPYISQVAVGKLKKLSVFGSDYPTRDGTGIRDYIHVMDLAKGHLKAMEKLKKDRGFFVYNLGTGQGYSVLEVISAFEKASKKKIPYQLVSRRPGDVAQSYASPSLANKELNWKAEKNLKEMCEDTWKWQRQFL